MKKNIKKEMCRNNMMLRPVDKMTKDQIAEIKKQAKVRKNRRLSDGEAARVMAQASKKLALEDGPNDLEVFDSKVISSPVVAKTIISKNKKDVPIIKGKAIKAIESKHLAPTHRITKGKVTRNATKEECLFTIEKYGNKDLKSTKKNRRLTTRQYKSLMKKATKELGLIDSKDDIGVMDLNCSDENDYERYGRTIGKILYCLSCGNKQDVVDEFEKIVKQKRITRFADKLNIINYLLNKPYLNANPANTDSGKLIRRGHLPYITAKIPMCLLSKKEKTNIVRRELSSKRHGAYSGTLSETGRILKKWGDIKERPFRVIPDNEYFLEISGKNRTKLDAFDKMSKDKKIQWARYANLITKIGSDDIEQIKLYNKSESDRDVVLFAMKYACKIMGIREFSGGFKNLYWILYRIIKYHREMTTKESGIWIKMSTNYAQKINGPNKTIPILNKNQAVSKLIPTLKKYRLYGKFVKELKRTEVNREFVECSPERSELALAKKLILSVGNHA